MIDFNTIIPRMKELYVSNTERFVMMKNGLTFTPKFGGKYKRLDDAALYAHLTQTMTVCVFGGERGTKFACFDVDIDDVELLRRVILGLTTYGIPYENICVSSSGGKGYHVEVFFDGEVATGMLKEMYMYITETSQLPRKKVEFRPTAKQSIKLPLGIHIKTGNICWYLDRNTFEPITGDEGYRYVFGIKRMPAGDIMKLVADHREEYQALFPPRQRKEMVDSDAEFPIITDGNFPKLTEPGTRHNTMVAIAVYLFAQGKGAEEIHQELLRWVDKQDPSLISSEPADIEADAAGIASWVMRNGRRYADPFITGGDLDLVLAQPTPLRRKLVFFLAAFIRRYGRLRMPGRAMSYYLGATQNYILKNLGELADEGFITMTGGGVGRGGNRPAREANTYSFGRRWPRADDEEIIRLEYDFRPDGFAAAFYTTLQKNVPAEMLRKRLRPKEREEALQFMNNNTEESTQNG